MDGDVQFAQSGARSYLNHRFVDEADIPINAVFALYPWEWLISEQGQKIAESFPSTTWVEPAWKMLWSNKAFFLFFGDCFRDILIYSKAISTDLTV